MTAERKRFDEKVEKEVNRRCQKLVHEAREERDSAICKVETPESQLAMAMTTMSGLREEARIAKC